MNPATGSTPLSPVTLDASGNIYGTTSAGGPSNWGVLFKLTPNGGGGYTESAVHGFSGSKDGAEPVYGVILGHGGLLYGTTQGGGNATDGNGDGVVFAYQP